MTFPTPLLPIQVRDNYTFAIVPTNNINGYVLAANTAQTITFPVDVNGVKPNYAIFNCNNDFYARWDGNTAIIPTSNTSDGLGSELNPTARIIQGLSTVSVIAPTASILSIAYYF